MANPPAPIDPPSSSVVTHGTILSYGLDDITVTGVLIDSYKRDAKFANVDEITPGRGLGLSPEMVEKERTLHSKAGQLRPLDSVFHTYTRHNRVLETSRRQILAGQPKPQHAWYVPKPKVVPDWDQPSAHPLFDKEVRDRATQLKNSRIIAKERSTVLKRQTLV